MLRKGTETHKMVKLNLGSGNYPRDGFINVDIDPNALKVDLVHDLTKPLPYYSGSVDFIFSSHLIEHFWMKDLAKLMVDWHRVLKDGGRIDIWTVDFDRIVGNYYDDKISFSDLTFRLYCRPEMEHHCCFPKVELIGLLKYAGFKEIGDIPINQFPFPGLHADCNMGVYAIK